MGAFRKNSAWWIDFYYQGKRYRQKIGSRKKDAEEALSRVKVSIASGEFVPLHNQKSTVACEFEAFVHNDFLPWSEYEHSAGHHIRLRGIINRHMLPYFG